MRRAVRWRLLCGLPDVSHCRCDATVVENERQFSERRRRRRRRRRRGRESDGRESGGRESAHSRSSSSVEAVVVAVAVVMCVSGSGGIGKGKGKEKEKESTRVTDGGVVVGPAASQRIAPVFLLLLARSDLITIPPPSLLRIAGATCGRRRTTRTQKTQSRSPAKNNSFPAKTNNSRSVVFPMIVIGSAGTCLPPLPLSSTHPFHSLPTSSPRHQPTLSSSVAMLPPQLCTPHPRSPPVISLSRPRSLPLPHSFTRALHSPWPFHTPPTPTPIALLAKPLCLHSTLPPPIFFLFLLTAHTHTH